MVGEKLINLIASEIMSQNISTIHPSEKISTAEIRMIKKNIGGLPVISSETNELLGIITQRDIQLSRAVIGTELSIVDDLYSKKPVTAKPDDQLPIIIKKMRDNNIERIPIVNNRNQVIGIVVMTDVIQILGKIFEEEGII